MGVCWTLKCVVLCWVYLSCNVVWMVVARSVCATWNVWAHHLSRHQDVCCELSVGRWRTLVVCGKRRLEKGACRHGWTDELSDQIGKCGRMLNPNLERVFIIE